MSLLLVASSSVATTVTTVASTATTAKSVSAFGLMLKLILGLAVVLGLIWVASRVMRGRVSGTKSVRRRQSPISIIGRQTLGKGVQLAVVKAGAETYLIGVTAQQVTRLARYQPDLMEELEALEASQPGGVAEKPLSLLDISSPPAGPVQASFHSAIRHLQERTVRKS